MELLIWAGGRWRRVCAASGRVAGWRRRVRYVCSRQGALRELAPLAALRAIVKGPRLPKQRYGKTAQTPLRILQKNASIQTDTDSIQVAAYKPLQVCNTQTAPQKVISQDDKENQVAKTHKRRCASTDITIRPFKKQKMDKTEAKDKLKALQNITVEEQRRKRGKYQRNYIKKPVKHYTTDSLTSSEEEFLINYKTEAKAKQKKTITIKERNSKPISQTSTTEKLVNDTTDSQNPSDEDEYKELIIDEGDVLLLRQYIETHDTNINLLKFDENDNYKMLVFYRINPLVRLERCPRIAKMLKNRDANVTIHFARQLGLRSVAEIEDIDQVKNKKPKYRADKAVATARNDEPVKKKVKEVTISLLNERSKKKNVKESCARSAKENDSEQYEARKTRRNRRESSDSDEFQVKRIIKKSSTKEVSKSQLISESDDEGRPKKDESKSDKKQTINNKKQTFKANTDNVKEHVKQNAHSSKQDIRQNTFEQVKKTKNDGFEENHKLKNTKRSALLNRMMIPKRSSVPPGREYSMLEDQAIVAWLSASTERERAVNGNRLWRELQEGYTKLTGQRRSWHSLRNRYLRYILPGLASLALPAWQTQRLRAHASLGKLKSRKKLRRNSIYNLPAVRSASARTRRPARAKPPPAGGPRHTSDSGSESQEESSPKQRVLRSSIAPPQSLSSNMRARTHNTLAKSPVKSPAKQYTSRSKSPSKACTRSPRLSPSYSELTRRLLRNRSTPQHSPQPAATHHKRRLYNPQRPASSGSSLS